MKIYFPITVDLYNIYPLTIMNIQQYNIGRGALVTLTAAGQVVVPDKESVYVYAKKKDGTIVYATCAINGNQVQISYDEQMAAVPGMLQMELQMVDGSGNNITTPIFLVNVQPSNIDYRTITSSNEFSALIDSLAKINNMQNQIDKLNENLGILSFKTAAVSGMNDLVETGFYRIQTSEDAPLSDYKHWYAVSVVDFGSGYTVQTAIALDVSSVCIRRKTNNIWGAWHENDVSKKFVTYNFKFGSTEVTEAFNFGRTYASNPILIGLQLGNIVLLNDSHITTVRVNTNNLTITRDSAASYKELVFKAIFYIA